MRHRIPGPWQPIAFLGTAFAVVALALTMIAASTRAGEHPGFGARTGGIGSIMPTLSTEPRFRRAAISEPRSLRPPNDPGAGTLLIAHRKLQDPNFLKSVVLLVDYSAEGAMGLIVNRPTTVALADAVAEAETLRGRPERLYAGGPVQRNRILLLIESQQPPADSFPVIRNLYMSASAAVLQQLVEDLNPKQRFRAYAGYAGWGPGQLDAELDRGDWQLWWADRDTVFSDEDVGLWQKLLSKSTQRWVRRPLGPRKRAPVSESPGELDPALAILAATRGIMDPRVRDDISSHRGLRSSISRDNGDRGG